MLVVVMRLDTFLIGIGVVAGLLARPALAQNGQTQSFTIKGHAHSVCSLSGVQSVQAANMALGARSANQPVINIPSLSNAPTAQLQPASISLMITMVCNRAHSLHIAAGNGGLQSQTGPDASAKPGFASHVNYAANAYWGAASAHLQTSGVLGEAAPEVYVPGAFSGSFVLQILIDESGAGHLPLLAGTYADTLTVTLSPHF
jgi:spore coat protein U-like protein